MKTNKKVTATIVMYATIAMHATSLIAQDTIYTTNNEQINGRVNKIGQNEIRYKIFENQHSVVRTISKTEVNKIKFENGSELKITHEKELANKKKTGVVKFHLLSPFMGNLGFGYERILKTGISAEGKLGIIGPGIGPNSQQATGYYLKGGVKFLLRQNIKIEGSGYTHPLEGRYVKLEAGYRRFDQKNIYKYVTYYSMFWGSYQKLDISDIDLHSTAASLSVIYGRQWIFDSSLTLEWYAGVGYGVQWNKYSDTNANDTNTLAKTNFSGFLQGAKMFPINLSCGITLGYLIN